MRWLTYSALPVAVVMSAVGASIPIAPLNPLPKFWVQYAVKRVTEGYPFGPSLSMLKGIASPSVNGLLV